MDFSEGDLARLSERGVSVERVEAQFDHYRRGAGFAKLLRPCIAGDGIRVLDETARNEFQDAYEKAGPDLVIAKFVPASGAASRMFRDLLAVMDRTPGDRSALEAEAASGDSAAKECLRFLDNLNRFPFLSGIDEALGGAGSAERALASGDYRSIVAAVVAESGLGYAKAPKGLLPFHCYDGVARTALEEHFVEAALYARGRGDLCRLHLTVSPEHMSSFQALIERVTPIYESRFSVRFEVELSIQEPSTDSLAADLQSRPFRDEHGELLFRPGGHGALVENLGRIDADVVFVKNIDNITVDSRRAPTVSWKAALAGVLLDLRSRSHLWLDRLGDAASESDVAGATEFLEQELGRDVSTLKSGGDVERLKSLLDRPLRVCGMVRNEGEPGGGPFWVATSDGPSAQIVETSQVDSANPEQTSIVAAATHFNPVDLVCCMRDRNGQPYSLQRFVDDDAVFIAEKSHAGRPLRSLELPGLWNGAMAGWNTVFVEVPLTTFQPVKTVNDLLRDAHQAG